MEILRVYAHLYLEKFHIIAIFIDIIKNDDQGDIRENPKSAFLVAQLTELFALCERGELPVTQAAVASAIYALTKEQGPIPVINNAIREFLERIHNRLPDELQSKLFFQLPYSRKEVFEKPTAKWEAAIKRFPESIRDIEEASRCFAFSRYAASVFHCVQIVEHGLLKLGEFLSVTDPISGWTAVANELKRVINKKHPDRTDFEKQHFQFIEQIQGTVEALKNAWRNKISHAHGQHLVLMSSDFTPDVAEDIMSATRAFMRRLAEELPT